MTNSVRDKGKKLLEKLEAEQADIDMKAEKYREVILKNEIYFIADAGKYITPGEGATIHDRKWTPLTIDSAHRFFGVTTPVEKQVFDDVLREMGRSKLRTVNSFLPQPSNVMNMLSRDEWLQPGQGSYDVVFDVLMNSLSAGRQNVRDHLEQVTVYKYLHPECYKLPCITISGQGGVGKNEYVEHVLATIFGRAQVTAIGTEEAFGGFNGAMLGKTVVFIDEALSDKVKTEQLKRHVGNKTLSVNVKYGIQSSDLDNTPWYWLGGNGTNGAVMLAGDQTDRRYSVLTVTDSIMYWVAKQIGYEGVISRKEPIPSGHPCVVWYEQHMKFLSDRTEVAKWLGAIVEKWKHLDSPPSCLHDEDYQTIRGAQKATFEEIMETVFTAKDFTHIEGKTLYTMFKLISKDDNPSGATKKKHNFFADVRTWIAQERLGIEWDKFKVNDKGRLTTTTGFVNVDVPVTKIRKRNTLDYIASDKNDREYVIEKTEKYDESTFMEKSA